MVTSAGYERTIPQGAHAWVQFKDKIICPVTLDLYSLVKILRRGGGWGGGGSCSTARWPKGTRSGGELRVCRGVRQDKFVGLSPGGAAVHLQRALGWSQVHKATHYFIHRGGLVGDPSFLEGLEVQPVDESCGAGGLFKIMENSSRRAALDTFN